MEMCIEYSGKMWENIVHCVKCFIRKMFCIISIFIVFVAYAEFPKAYEKKQTINAA